MITREQLELAALAAGHTIGWGEETPCQPHVAYIWNADGKTSRWWRPHLDDGDSRRLQLAVRATLSVFCDSRNVAEAWCFRPGPMITAAVPHDGSQTDAARAAREAVTLCAAAVGERMRKGGA